LRTTPDPFILFIMKTEKFFATVLLISLSATGLSGCLLAAAGAGAEAGYVLTQKDRTTGEVLDDQRITATVKSKLLADMEVPGLDINVDTFKAKVTLKGVLASDELREKALNLAASVSGVKSVESKLFVE